MHLLVVFTSDRGLCGGFNSQIVRLVREHIRRLEAAGKTVKIISVGKKGTDLMRRDFGDRIVARLDHGGARTIGFSAAETVADKVGALRGRRVRRRHDLLLAFVNVITQVPTAQRIIPAEVPKAEAATTEAGGATALYEYEPGPEEILADLIPRNIKVSSSARSRKRRLGAGRPDERDGQRHAQRRRHDQQALDLLQPSAPGADHDGTDRDHRGRRAL